MAAFNVTLTGGAPWGFSMAGGIDFNQPLNVSKVTRCIHYLNGDVDRPLHVHHIAPVNEGPPTKVVIVLLIFTG